MKRLSCLICTALTADEWTTICDDCADVKKALREGKAVTSIIWDESAQVYEAWGVPTEERREYLGAYDSMSDARIACRGWVESHTEAKH